MAKKLYCAGFDLWIQRILLEPEIASILVQYGGCLHIHHQMNNPQAMADAIITVINEESKKDENIDLSRFSVEYSINRLLELIGFLEKNM